MYLLTGKNHHVYIKKADDYFKSIIDKIIFPDYIEAWEVNMQKHIVKSCYRILSAEQMFKPDTLPLRLWLTRRSEGTGFHVHEFSEIAVVLRGSANYRTDFSSRKISKGDILCTPEGAGHAYTDEEDFELMNILFQFDRLLLDCRGLAHLPGFSVLFTLQLPFYQKHGFYPVVRLPQEDFSRCEDMLRWLYKLQNSQFAGAQLAVLGGFIQLITLLVNNYSPPPELSRELRMPGKISEACSYMQLHFTEPLNIAAIARKAGMSEVSFYRHFKNATGQTPAEYLINLRLNMALELLQTTPATGISDIALQSGFNDSSYFARLFRRKFGFSPRQFRSRQSRM